MKGSILAPVDYLAAPDTPAGWWAVSLYLSACFRIFFSLGHDHLDLERRELAPSLTGVRAPSRRSPRTYWLADTTAAVGWSLEWITPFSHRRAHRRYLQWLENEASGALGRRRPFPRALEKVLAPELPRQLYPLRDTSAVR